MNPFVHRKYALRQIRKNPGFFGVAVAALALGIGANTAIFSAVEAVLLKPLPYAQPERLVIVWEDMSYIGFPSNTPAPANFMDWRAQNQVFTDMAATRFAGMSLTGDGPPEQLAGRKVTPNFFDVLGVQPFLGRPFTAEEDKAQRAVVVLSYDLWKRRFAGDPATVGRSILPRAHTNSGNYAQRIFLPRSRSGLLGADCVHARYVGTTPVPFSECGGTNETRGDY